MKIHKKVSLIFLLVVLLSLLVPRITRAQTGEDYVTATIEALQTSRVYVAPGAEGTNYETKSKLEKFLNPEDNIVLVVLPAEALNSTDMYTLVQKISVGIGDQRTIGLAVGREMIGYSPVLPEGVASDKMARASSVSNDPITALITFTQNIHYYQAGNPQPTATPMPVPTKTPRPAPKPVEVPVKTRILFVVVFVAIIVFVFVRFGKSIRRVGKLKQSESMIAKIQMKVSEIQDRRVRSDMDNACNAAYGLLEIFQQSGKYLGYVESKFPVLLSNVYRQVNAWIRHEKGRRPLPPEYVAQLKSILLNYDALFIKLQENDPESVELIASMIDSNNAMISSLGYLPDDE